MVPDDADTKVASFRLAFRSRRENRSHWDPAVGILLSALHAWPVRPRQLYLLSS